MAGNPGFSADDVENLRQKLTNTPGLTDPERRLLDAIFDTARASAGAPSGSQPTTLSDAEIGTAELRDLLTQFLDAFTPGNSPGSVTQINIFSKISPAPPGGGDRPGKISPAPPPPPPPPPGKEGTTPGEGGMTPSEGASGGWGGE